MTTPLTAFLPLVLNFAPGCPEVLAVAHLRAAAIEFCERTKCWRVIQSTPLNAQGQALVTPATATIHLIEEATIDGRELVPVQFTDVGPDELAQSAASGEARYITQIEPGKVQIYPFKTGGILRVSAFLKPRHDPLYNTKAGDPFDDANAVVPDFLFQQDAEAISWGALARIKAIPQRRFSDKQEAADYERRFSAACDKRFSRHMRGQQRAPIRTKPSWM